MGDVDGATPWRAVRVVLGLQFLVSGLFSAVSWSDTVSFNETLAGTAGAPVFTAVGAALLILGGLLLIVGYRIRVASIAVVVFLVPATIRHFMIARDIGPDLALADLAERGQLSSGVKNLALIAVMLLIAQRGMGPLRRET